MREEGDEGGMRGGKKKRGNMNIGLPSAVCLSVASLLPNQSNQCTPLSPSELSCKRK